jgi:Fibronectin type III domain/Immunoglobulin I-set domain
VGYSFVHYKVVMARMILVCAVAFVLLRSSVVSGASLTVGWNPSPSADVAGYILYYGLASRKYSASLNAGIKTTMTITGLTPGKTYYLAVASYNTAGGESAYSNEATNTMPASPVVLTQPQSQTATIGTLVVFSVNISSATPVTFKWFVGGKAIAGATNSMLILPQISETNAGSYYVVAYNSGGNVSSKYAVLTVLDLTAAPSGSAPTVLAGSYSGLFYQTTASGVPSLMEATTGYMPNFTIGAKGGYSARLMVEGQPFACSGKVNAAGEVITIAQPIQAGPSNLSLSLYPDTAFGAQRLTGVVSNMNPANPWVAPLSAILLTNAFSSAAYLYLSPPPVGQAAESRTCKLTVTTNGQVMLSGQLGDGASIQQTGFAGADGSFPVYQRLYNNTGLLSGWITFAEGAPIGNLTWIRPDNTATGSAGFTNTVSFGAGPGLSANCFQFIQ